MGKTKWYNDEPENNTQRGLSASVHRSRKRQSNSPGRYLHETPDAPPIPVLLRQILLRLRRSWIAFRFQLNRYTLGVFEGKTTALKAAGLAGIAYMLFFSERSFFRIGGTPDYADMSYIERIGDGGPERKPVGLKGGNEAAPVSASDLFEKDAESYIGRYSEVARREMTQYGIPASISLAQGLVESRAGTSKLAVNNNNHFGMKCFSRKCKKGHCSNFTDDTHKDFFRKYTNPWDSWRDHSKMLASGRYASLKKYGRDYRKWAYGLKSIGYATDRTYAEKLIGMIERYELHRFDR